MAVQDRFSDPKNARRRALSYAEKYRKHYQVQLSRSGWYYVKPEGSYLDFGYEVVFRTSEVVSLTQAAQDAQQTPNLPRAEDIWTEPELDALQRKESPQIQAEEPWQPPTADQMQASLERFLMGRNVAGYRNTEVVNNYPVGNGKLPMFLEPEDWRNVMWAANAWTILNHLMDNPYENRSDTHNLIAKSSRRAASIWRK